MLPHYYFVALIVLYSVYILYSPLWWFAFGTPKRISHWLIDWLTTLRYWNVQLHNIVAINIQYSGWYVARGVPCPADTGGVYCTLVVSKVDYCNSVLAGLPVTLLQKLQSIQNAAVWLVFSARRSEHITPLLCQLHWLRVSQRIQFLPCVLT